MKRLIWGVLLLFALAILLLPLWSVEAQAEILVSGSCGKNATWTMDDKGVVTVNGTGPMFDYGKKGAPWYEFSALVKEVVIKKGITTVGDWAFHWCTCMKKVTIPSSVTFIGEHAFDSCTDLTEINLPNSVTQIGDAAFSCCWSLTKLTIPDSVTAIGASAFSYCSKIKNLTLGKGVTTIGNSAFYDCSALRTVTISKNVLTIGAGAFRECEVLNGIWVDTDNPNYSNDNFGVLFNKDKTKLLMVPGGLKGTYAIPDSVITVSGSSFSGCDDLTDVVVGNNVRVIEGGAFSHCSNLKRVTIPESVTSIGALVFGWTGLEDVYYLGSRSQWEQIEIDSDNGALTKWSTIHYAKHDHVYATETVIPDCIRPGGTKYTCQCGHVYMGNIQPALGHTFFGGNCTVCGAPERKPGDADGNDTVNEDDAIYLLQHILMPDLFALYQEADFDCNGMIDEDDAVYLLQHVLMPDMFPLVI